MILSHFLIVVFIPYECNENPTQGGGRKKERLERAERVTILISSNLEKLDCVLIFPICNTKLFPPLSNVSHRCVSSINTSNRCYWDSTGLTLKSRYAATCSLTCMVRHLTPLAFIFITCVIGFSEILASMMRRETGSKTLRSERVLSRGDPNFNGTAMVSVMTPGMNPPKRQQDYLAESLLPRFIILELNNNG